MVLKTVAGLCRGHPGTLAEPSHEAQLHNSPLTTILTAAIIYYLPLNNISENLKVKWERLQSQISVKFIQVPQQSFNLSKPPITQGRMQT